MIVLDASAAFELVTETETGAAVARRLLGESVYVPAHFDVEAVGAIRRQTMQGALSPRDGENAYTALRRMRLRRRTITSGIDRAWALRHSLTVADALYIALAERLLAPLLTCDAGLAHSHGHEATIEMV
jgi:predicted nucleic acid-binding protein